jgi:hypothetical protein
MAGAEIVCANLEAWHIGSKLTARGILEAHMARCQDYARASHPWVSRTGYTEGSLYHSTFVQGTTLWGDVGYSTFRAGYWLENPHYNVYPYGNKSATPFGTRFQILEKARDHNILSLYARLKALFGPGGVGLFGGYGYME